MGITLFIIVTLIFGTYILSNVDGKKAGYAILATAAMAFILLGISLIYLVTNFFMDLFMSIKIF